jgi:hypothetical protein
MGKVDVDEVKGFVTRSEQEYVRGCWPICEIPSDHPDALDYIRTGKGVNQKPNGLLGADEVSPNSGNR